MSVMPSSFTTNDSNYAVLHISSHLFSTHSPKITTTDPLHQPACRYTSRNECTIPFSPLIVYYLTLKARFAPRRRASQVALTAVPSQGELLHRAGLEVGVNYVCHFYLFIYSINLLICKPYSENVSLLKYSL